MAYLADSTVKSIPTRSDYVSLFDYAAMVVGPDGETRPSLKRAPVAALDVVRGVFNVTDPAFGATGDGTTDDTAAILAAIAAADAAITAGNITDAIIYFPPPPVAYKVTDWLDWEHNGITFRGAGRRTKIKNAGAAGKGVFRTPVGVRGFTIEHLYIAATSGSGQGACILISENFGEGTIRDVEISAYGSDAGVQQVDGNGIHLTMEQVRVNGGTRGFDFDNDTANVPINTIAATNCYANDCEGDGWYTKNVFQFVATGCSADNCGQRTLTGYGFQLTGTHSTLVGCTTEDNGVVTTRPSGGYYIPSGTYATFISCATLDQGQPWNINATTTVYLLNCRTAGTIPYGSSLAIAGGASVTVQGGLITSISANTAFKTKIGTQFYSTEATVAWNGETPLARQTVTGSRGGNAALASLLTALAAYGLITDSSS